MAVNSVGSPTINEYRALVEGANKDLAGAKLGEKEILRVLNGQGWKDASGNALKFDNMDDWMKALKTPGVTCPGLGKDFTLEGMRDTWLAPTIVQLRAAQDTANSVGENLQSLEAMKKLLDSGDIEGAVMLLQTTRAKGLEQQLNNRLSALQDRNAQIKSLNDDMVRLQKEKNDLGKDDTTGRGNKDTDIAAKKGEIDKLNSDSQIDMIGIQGLVNKRNESFDMLTNLLGKFQKTIDGIVGNMR